ncbi:Mur ligase family protein [Alkalithermobacter paradoxus]|uniref:UDP-N-acetylmuramoyl-L-alanyl-D-glutamate--2, 6-diaminopimelate ligase n=1 Tax=Alkalithermobacter paradoxus TaxID=29349 RepID=A0A1V4I592_9FIRM|nr:UDP-N-acetylmuramoyl-L-alanyl-D-glutamate--2,6-diaminopimelate ligase [[Clostridium] thermoalcaliphilum]
MIKLYELLKSIDIIDMKNEKNVDVTGIAYNSKNVTPGDIFVCIKGYKTDGHKYIFSAISNGAVAIVVEDFQEGWDIPQIKVSNSRYALAALSDYFYGCPSKKLKMIGITATNGKTTTTFMTNSILEAYGIETGVIGTVSIKIGNNIIPSQLTTPESLDLHRYLHSMNKEGISHVAMEVSSSALELSRVGNVEFDIVAFNNISREHIDLHGSFENYFDSKASLIRNASEKQWAILNLDCPYSASLVNQTKAKTLTFGIENNTGDLWCRDIDLSTGRAKFIVEVRKEFKVDDIVYKPTMFDIELSTPGYHSVYNAMVAIMAGLLCGVPIPVIQKGINQFKGVERRFEIIFEDEFKIIDDHFANPGNINITLETLQKMKYNNLKLVYAIRGNRGPIVNKENAQMIAKWAPKLDMNEIIVTLSKSHVTEKDRVQDEELIAFQRVMSEQGIKVHLYEELSDAIEYALSGIGNDDVLMLAGCQGMDYGAKIALEILSRLKPYIDTKVLFRPLEKRVAGME